MPPWDIVSAPITYKVSFLVQPVPILLNVLGLIGEVEQLSGLPEWVIRTAQALTPEQRHEARLCDHLLPTRIIFNSTHQQSFSSFINALEESDAQFLRDEALSWLEDAPNYPGLATLLAQPNSFVSYMQEFMSDKGIDVEEKFWLDVYYYLTHPKESQALMVRVLRFMWDKFMRTEWGRVEKTLTEVVKAHSQIHYDGGNWGDIIEAVTGRDMRQHEKLTEYATQISEIVFIPTPFLGPYLSIYRRPDQQDLVIFFGARLPRGAKLKSDELDRADLLVRLNALADETRLRVLELLTEQDEICAQDFMTLLDLSQSSASRHLRQLTASGYVTERRRDVAKCYALNRERIQETIQALSKFLDKK